MAELDELRQQEQAELVMAIAAIVGGHNFTASELWAHAEQVSPDLRALFVEHGITNPRRLGKRLQQIQRAQNTSAVVFSSGVRLERIGADHQVGAIWRVFLDSPSGP